MKTMNLEFDGKNYVCRVVNSNESEELVIAPTSLLDALHPHSFGEENDGFANEEAVQIDEEVFFYTEDANLTLSDDELVAELKESNPEWFD